MINVDQMTEKESEEDSVVSGFLEMLFRIILRSLLVQKLNLKVGFEGGYVGV